jgi:biotin synthase
MPRSMVRLSAGRMEMSDEAQALCFVAGANSIFMGERLLTTPNPIVDKDKALLDKLGMKLFADSKPPAMMLERVRPFRSMAGTVEMEKPSSPPF